MVLGLSMNRVDKDAREQLYAMAKNFVDRFKTQHGSILCTELLGCDISTEEGLKKAREENRFKALCPKYLKRATQILQEILRL